MQHSIRSILSLSIFLQIINSPITLAQDVELLKKSVPEFQAQAMPYDTSWDESLKSHFNSYEIFHLDLLQLNRFLLNQYRKTAFLLNLGTDERWEFRGNINTQLETTEVLEYAGNQIRYSELPMPIVIEGKAQSSRLVVNQDYISGWFDKGDERYYVERLEKYIPNVASGNILIYKGSDIRNPINGTCGVKVDYHNSLHSVPQTRSSGTTLPGICLDLLLTADTAFYGIHGVNTLNEVVSIYTGTQAIYSGSNIGINFQLSSVVIFTDSQPYTPIINFGEVDVLHLLDIFAAWRADPENAPPHDAAQLLSGYEFAGSTIGLAHVSAMCSATRSAGVNQVNQFPAGQNYALVAHEMGHNLGARHDNQENPCSTGFIMQPNASIPPATQFSSCSKDEFLGYYNSSGLLCSGCVAQSCAYASSIDCSQSVVDSTTYFSGNNDSLDICGEFIDNGAPGIWYTFLGTGDSITLSTCNPLTNFATQIGVFSGTCGNLICVDGNNNIGCAGDTTGASVSIFAEMDSTYFVFVTGSSVNDTGIFELSITNAVSAKVIYVNKSATGGDGSSWDSAFVNLHDAIDPGFCAAGRVLEVWVAQGDYYPEFDIFGATPADSRDATFLFDFDLHVLGGFPNTGDPGKLDRDWRTHQTILNGDLGVAGSIADNTYSVLTSRGITEQFLLDGFMIKNGNAPNSGLGSSNNSGGGWFNIGSPTVNNCRFQGNQATFGGAVINDGSDIESSPKFVNCEFVENYAGFGGGAVCNYAFRGISSPEFINTIFLGNAGLSTSGAIYNFAQSGMSNPFIINCSFSANSPEAMVNFDLNGGESTPTIMNSIFWENGSSLNSSFGTPKIYASLIQEASCPANATCDSNTLFAIDPLFLIQPNLAAAPTDIGDLHLKRCSPLREMGVSAYNMELLDLDGIPRITGTIDLGAYERPNLPLMVTTTANDGAGSLRQAVLDACQTDSIGFDSALNNTPVMLDGLITLTKNLSIRGNASTLGIHTILDGGNKKILKVNGGFDSHFENLEFRNALGTAGTGLRNQGQASVRNCLFSNCHAVAASGGGAVLNDGIMSIYTTTFTGNSATVQGGALQNSGTLTLWDSYFVSNTAPEGAAIKNIGSLTIDGENTEIRN